MKISIGTKARRAALAAAALATVSIGVAPAAYAQSSTLIPGVTGCDAPGGQQAGGALIGALIGGALGNSLGRHDRTAGTVAGAAVGAGIGSYVGCSRQQARAREYGYEPQYGQGRYEDAGYRRDVGYGAPRYVYASDREVTYQPHPYPVRVRHHHHRRCR